MAWAEQVRTTISPTTARRSSGLTVKLGATVCVQIVARFFLCVYVIAKFIQMNIMHVHVHVVMESVLFPGIGGKHVHTCTCTCMHTCTHVQVQVRT